MEIYGILGVVFCKGNDKETLISNSISFVILIPNMIVYFRMHKQESRLSTSQPLNINE